jgi:mRNA-degrading endonuclease toxin of MazEF toxin-antitoxin module
VTINRGDIVIAPFRFTDVDRYCARPVLIVSRAEIYGETRHVIGVMVTLAASSAWPLDVPIKDCVSANLREGSIIRLKLFSIADDVLGPRIGRICDQTLSEVCGILQAVLG